MDKHLPEKNLDKILEGKMSPDELGNFWQWLKMKMAAAPASLDEYWNIHYLRHMRQVLFDSCQAHAKYHGFYVDELMKFDFRRFRERAIKEDEDTDFQASLIITKLTHEAEEAQKANE